MEKKIYIKTDQEMVELGEAIGKLIFPNMVITMEGDLGAGKTTMTKGIGKAMGVSKIINSPTFTILKIYQGTLPLYHMDVYRISNNSGDDYLEEFFYSGGVCVVEWANNISDMLPLERLAIEIAIDDSFNRLVTISSKGSTYDELIKKINFDGVNI